MSKGLIFDFDLILNMFDNGVAQSYVYNFSKYILAIENIETN